MSADDDILGFFESDEIGVTVEFEFELVNSADGKTVTLVCYSNRELDPLEYAEALKAFAERIQTIATMGDVQSGVLN